MPRKRSAFSTPCSVTETVLCFSSNSKSKSATNSFLVFGSMPSGRLPGFISRRQLGELDVEVGRLLGGAGDDQRRARLVDEDVVDLVDDREVVHADRLAVLVDAPAVLDLLLQRRRHVVAQVVEAELGVRAVRDVRRVGGALLLVGLHVLQHADREAEAAVDRRHPLGVAAGQVVVDRHDVDALAGQRVEHDGERGGQRLALAGLHLGDRAGVQHHAADHLDVEVAHAHRAPRGLADDRERLGQQVVERLAVAGALAQRVGVRAQLVVVEQLELGLPAVDAVDALGVLLELLAFAQPEGAVEDRHGSEDRGPRGPSGPRAAHRSRRRLPGRRGLARLLVDGSAGPPRVSASRRAPRGAAAALVAVALDLARQVLGDQVDRVLEVARRLARAQRRRP